MKLEGSRNVSSEEENKKRRNVWRNWREGAKMKMIEDGQKKRRGELKESRLVHKECSNSESVRFLTL